MIIISSFAKHMDRTTRKELRNSRQVSFMYIFFNVDTAKTNIAKKLIINANYKRPLLTHKN